MNYYNPYFYTAPTSLSTLSTPRVGILSRLFGRAGVTLSGIINGTQRALTFANQAIPFVKQVRPMIGNAKTMFKVMNEFKRAESPKNTINTVNKNVNNSINNSHKKQINKSIENNYAKNNDGPIFFI